MDHKKELTIGDKLLGFLK